MSEQTAIYSAYGADPDLADLVQRFVAGLPARLVCMDRASCDGDLNELGRLAHKMKGAAGSYGFAQIAHAAAGLERAARAISSPAAAEQSLRRLTSLCHLARAGECRQKPSTAVEQAT